MLRQPLPCHRVDHAVTRRAAVGPAEVFGAACPRQYTQNGLFDSSRRTHADTSAGGITLHTDSMRGSFEPAST